MAVAANDKYMGTAKTSITVKALAGCGKTQSKASVQRVLAIAIEV